MAAAMGEGLFSAGQRLLDAIWPRKCVLCGERVTEETDGLCPACSEGGFWTGEQCRRAGMNFERCISPLYYQDEVKQSFHRYKFQDRWHYNWFYGKWMWEYLREYEPDYERFDYITWTPLSARRCWKRGYDQAQRLALVVSKYSGLPLKRALVKEKHTAAQSGTNRAEDRWKNVKGAYGAYTRAEIARKRILLIDDVITTGATLEEAAMTLREEGAREVCCLTLARSQKPWEESRNGP